MTRPHSTRTRLGVLLHRGRDSLFERFMDAMAEHGYVSGQTITFVPRFAEGVLERTASLAEDLVRQNVDLIVAIGAVGANACHRVTSKIPIIFAIVLDPVELGFAATLERPGGNMTGVTNFDPGLAREQLALLQATLPGLDRVAVLSDADIPRPHGGNPLERSYEDAAASLGIALEWFRVRGPTPDRASVFREMASRGFRAVQVLEVPRNIADFETIAALANEHRLASMFPDGWQHNGLMSFGTSLLQTIPEIPPLVDLILSGTRAGDIPVRLVRRHRFCVNLATALQIGIDVPHHVIARAAKIIR